MKIQKPSRRKALALITAGVITAGGIYLATRNPDLLEKAKSGTDEDKQLVLSKAFEQLKPEHLSQIIYDPYFSHLRSYLKNQLKKTSASEQEIAQSISSAERSASSHLISIAGVTNSIGDKEKRPAFAREELFSYQLINSINDIASCIRHENTHAEEQRLGYDFGNRRLYGEELTSLLNERLIRPEILSILAEIPAYAAQLKAILEGKDKVSKKLKEKTKHELRTAKKVCERQLKKENFTDLEAQYITHNFRKYKEVIEEAHK